MNLSDLVPINSDLNNTSAMISDFPIRIYSPNARFLNCNALVDSGCTINSSIVLSLDTAVALDLNIQTFSSSFSSFSKQRVQSCGIVSSVSIVIANHFCLFRHVPVLETLSAPMYVGAGALLSSGIGLSYLEDPRVDLPLILQFRCHNRFLAAAESERLKRECQDTLADLCQTCHPPTAGAVAGMGPPSLPDTSTSPAVSNLVSVSNPSSENVSHSLSAVQANLIRLASGPLTPAAKLVGGRGPAAQSSAVECLPQGTADSVGKVEEIRLIRQFFNDLTLEMEMYDKLLLKNWS